jgi:hypothetical protein
MDEMPAVPLQKLISPVLTHISPRQSSADFDLPNQRGISNLWGKINKSNPQKQENS